MGVSTSNPIKDWKRRLTLYTKEEIATLHLWNATRPAAAIFKDEQTLGSSLRDSWRLGAKDHRSLTSNRPVNSTLGSVQNPFSTHPNNSEKSSPFKEMFPTNWEPWTGQFFYYLMVKSCKQFAVLLVIVHGDRHYDNKKKIQFNWAFNGQKYLFFSLYPI